MRLSVTELDAYRYWRDNEHEDDAAALAALLAQMRRETAPTVAMQAGSAWHKALQFMEWGENEAEVVKADGFTFRIVGDIELNLPEVAELKGEWDVMTPSEPVTLVGVVDGIDHQGVRDYKLTGRFDAERYTDSYQWRCYLLMFAARRFVYEIFVGREDARTGEWLIGEYHQMPFYAYPNLEADVRREVAGFAAFVAAHLPERVATAVAA